MINRILLQNFRNYTFAEFPLKDGVNYIKGRNGIGKTNLLEAISMLGLSSGFRGADLGDLNGNFEAPFLLGFETKMGYIGMENAAQGKKILLDGESIRLSSLAKKITILHLLPEEEFIFSGSTAEKRGFFDRLVGLFFAEHEEAIKQYRSLASERLKILDSYKQNEAWLSTIERRLAECSVIIATNRILALEKLGEAMEGEVRAELRGKIIMEGAIERMLLDGEPALSCEKAAENMLAASRKEDAQRGKTTTGVMRTNFDILYETKRILASKASSGEQKKLIFALILAASRKLLQQNRNIIILIDEVISKLDEANRRVILEELSATNCQSFLTGTEEISGLATLNLELV